ncbi:Mariner Mos1 transposase [Eumeta japonica]|uniref:Mariner Mos1 transposase n=1 Tax=Eumeta variegata TaxID=151549 RepID=A0A4C1V997_EUMVA|nr:Mariner Mos1 transposase [Eumeta japonica]
MDYGRGVLSQRLEPAGYYAVADKSRRSALVAWDWKGIIYYELLPPGKTINSGLHCQQLMRLEQEVENKRPESMNRKGVILHHDNARPQTSLATQQILRDDYKFGIRRSLTASMNTGFSYYLRDLNQTCEEFEKKTLFNSFRVKRKCFTSASRYPAGGVRARPARTGGRAARPKRELFRRDRGFCAHHYGVL